MHPPEGAEETIEADVCIVGSGAGGGVIAGELAAAGKSVVRARDGRLPRRPRLRPARALRLPAAVPQRRAVPDRRGPGRRSSPAPAVGGGTVVNWTNCLRTHDWVREEWAREHGLEGLDGPEFDAHLDAVWERLGVNADCSDLSGPHLRHEGGCREARLRLPADHPQRRPATCTTRRRRPTWASATVGLEAVDREDLPARRPARRRADHLRLPGRADPGRGRPRRRRRGGLHRSGDAAATALDGVDRPRAGGRRRLRLARVAGAAAALADRRARRPATTCACTRRRRHRLLRRAPELVLGPAAGGALARVRRPRRRPRLPVRGGAVDHRPDRGRGAVALGPRAQADDEPLGPRRAADQPAARARPRPGRDRRRRQPGPPVPGDQRARHPRHPRRRSSSWSASTRRPAREEIVGSHRKARDWSRGDDLEAFIADAQLAPDRAPRLPALLRPPDGHAAGWAPTRRPRSPTRGASCTTRRASGSATRAPSRAPRGRTRC